MCVMGMPTLPIIPVLVCWLFWIDDKKEQQWHMAQKVRDTSPAPPAFRYTNIHALVLVEMSFICSYPIIQNDVRFRHAPVFSTCFEQFPLKNLQYTAGYTTNKNYYRTIQGMIAVTSSEPLHNVKTTIDCLNVPREFL